MTVLDKSRHYGTVGCASWTFYSQDGKLFDMRTLEEVDPATKGSSEPKPTSVLTCKFCGAKRETPELMKEHLLALHKDDMEKAKAEQSIEAQKAKIDAEEQCPRCGASKRIDAKEGEWQFTCGCNKFEIRDLAPEKPKDDEMVTVENVLHKRETEKTPAPKRRGRPRKNKGVEK